MNPLPQRSSKPGVDPTLAQQLRELGQTIARLQRQVQKLEEQKNRPPAQVPAGAIRDFRRLLACLESEPVEDGVSHSAEPLLQSYLSDFSGMLPWQEALGGEPSARILSDFLRLAGRVHPDSQLKAKLLEQGLASENIEVRDAAVQAAELWADPGTVSALRQHQERVPWLADYIQRVILDIVGDAGP